MQCEGGGRRTGGEAPPRPLVVWTLRAFPLHHVIKVPTWREAMKLVYAPFFRAVGGNMFGAAELSWSLFGAPCICLCLPALHLPNISLQCGSVGDDLYFLIQLTLNFHPKSFIFFSPPEPMGLRSMVSPAVLETELIGPFL